MKKIPREKHYVKLSKGCLRVLEDHKHFNNVACKACTR